MDPIYQINTELDIPIYQQLVDAIRLAVKQGSLEANRQLPTVQEMSARLGVARGTIKRAYDELERMGLVEKVQGRGTFVCYRPENSHSSKEQAMAAIDKLLNDLESMGFSAAEINIFLNLKLRERAEEESQVKVALIECNTENLTHMSEQLRTIPRVDLYTHLVESLEEYPYKLGEDLDLIVTTAAHADFIQKIMPDRSRIARVALKLTNGCLSEIIKLRRGKVVGILSYSSRFGQLLYSTCQMYTEGVVLKEQEIFSADLDIASFLEGKDTILVPESYEKYCSSAIAQALEQFHGRVIECSYEMDEGSFIYLREKTKRILEEKTI